MRLFTAIDIPEAARGALAEAVARWKPLAKISWSPTSNLHITTKFIGERPQERLDELQKTLAAIPRPGAIAIAIRGIGWFPNERRPRVLWAGVEADESLAKLAQATEQAVASLGVTVEERPYTPHLTLARIREPDFYKSGRLDALRGAIDHCRIDPANTDFGSFRADHFTLYLSAAGRYTPLASFPLAFPFEPSALRSSS